MHSGEVGPSNRAVEHGEDIEGNQRDEQGARMTATARLGHLFRRERKSSLDRAAGVLQRCAKLFFSCFGRQVAWWFLGGFGFCWLGA